MILTDSGDNSNVYRLKDGSEIEITIIELEGVSSKVVTNTDESIKAVREHLTAHTDTI